jgi:hypothetical protein
MYDIFKKIKLIFDDKYIMNPGKKILFWVISYSNDSVSEWG